MMDSISTMAVILNIQNESSRNKKLQILKSQPAVQSVFKICYNPYWQFNVKPTQSWIQGQGIERFTSDTESLLRKLIRRDLSGAAAKRAVISELSRLEPMSQELLMRILSKDMRCGLGPKSINTVFPGLIPEFPVQLAKLYDPSKAVYPCLASYKIDGLRCVWENGKLYSRRGHELVGLGHIQEAIAPIAKEFGLTRLDGELTVPGKLFDDISGDIRSFKHTPNAVYNVFDAHKAEPICLAQRLSIAYTAAKIIQCPNISIVQHYTVRDENEALDMYEQAKANGYEGLMLKREDGMAFDGRNYDWMKIKPKDTVDVKVISIAEGKGKNELRVGALVCDFGGNTIRVGGGLSDDQRDRWFSDPDLIVGKMIEVDYMELSKNGALRHPRLVSVRGDLC